MTTVITQSHTGESYIFDQDRLLNSIQEIGTRYPKLDINTFAERAVKSVQAKSEYSTDQIINLLILNALENLDQNNTDWTYVAAEFYLQQLYQRAAANRGFDEANRYGSLNYLIQTLVHEGIYSRNLIEAYTEEEIDELQTAIDPDRDRLFTYIGVRTLADRYLATDHEKNVFELPQERFMIIAMTLMSKEKDANRIALVKEAYWALSNLYMTVATPTLANAGKSYGQLSSCFIDTVEDSLEGIYNNNTDVARLSKSGGGLGVYLGKIRSLGSDIKGFKGNSSGIMPWMKQLNGTAVSVDQLGQRQGAIAVYYNVFGRDIFSFLEAKLNNGDERFRTHDIFTGVCIPDLFMKRVEERREWYIFDPHTIKKTLGFELDDFFDAEVYVDGEPDEFKHAFTYHYKLCVEAAIDGRFGEKDILWKVVPAIDIFKSIMKSQLETGTPYMFYRDTVNRDNANSDKGMIYCSNLCTEIMQNMSATTMVEEITQDGKIVKYFEPGDFVVCNLSSISLAKAVQADVLARLIPIQVRMLDNVIDLNTLDVLQAQMTNKKYRAVGLGTYGWHHLLAVKGIKWESDEAVAYADELYEEIAYLTFKASADLAIEKGAYPAFEGSQWSTGEYLGRKYSSKKWMELRDQIIRTGIRNGWLIAVAPNATTAIIAGSTASTDPVFKRLYSEEKKNYKIPVAVPDLNAKTYWLYKNAYEIDQHWSIKQQAARQKHVDQSVSFNLYVRNDIKAKDLLALHVDAWKSGLKTTYYVRNTGAGEIKDCEACSS